MERESAICFGCEREFASNEITHFCNASFCPDCLELETAVCAECGSREWTGNLEYVDDNAYCASCAERRLVRCGCCGRWIERENALGSKPYICESCCTAEQYEPAIHEYGYKPMPVFHGEGPRFFGVELEIDGGELISSFACEPETVVSEFSLSKREYRELTGRVQESDIIAYQIRQSFKPGEVSPEEANSIGYEFAERFLKGNHAFIVCTHTDKSHIHNHI